MIGKEAKDLMFQVRMSVGVERRIYRANPASTPCFRRLKFSASCRLPSIRSGASSGGCCRLRRPNSSRHRQ
ncbi:hypothetical protein ACMD2_06992 [Ananas comosus]|uniref:Uncharacterized protein n=1 Tax=Ananas comosus TaxID=4615 RepID=A0A199VN17_ANACO|nr:hypothetical protein ACMD2_06992 [Ananas comosus]